MAIAGNMKGHFLLLKSPDAAGARQREKSRLPGSPSESLNNLLDTEVHEMHSWLAEQGLQPHPWNSQTNQIDEDEIIHSKETFEARFRELAHLRWLPHSWEVIIYYTGHGMEETGDWALSANRVLALEDVIEKLKEMSHESAQVANVLVICDCCYSGQWIDRAKQLQAEGKLKLESDAELSIALQASAGGEETAAALSFVRTWPGQLQPTADVNQTYKAFATRPYQARSMFASYLQGL